MTEGAGERASLRVGLIGCGAVGTKRADALGHDTLVGCFDVDPRVSNALSRRFGGRACASVDDLLAMEPDVVVVAVTHDALADNACHALHTGAHVLVEKPAGIGVADVDRIAETAEAVGRLVKVGFNHRFHPAISRAVSEAASGRFGPITHVRGRYGHGGRIGYEREWRADRARSGGGELVDQGMHLLDLSYALLGPLPLHSALLRTAFWPMDVEDNAIVILGERESGPWAMFHTSWTEWKNLFSLEVFCATGKLQVDGLAGSYGEQRLVIFAMRPEMGPPDVEELTFPSDDTSWAREWAAFTEAIVAGDDRPLRGDLQSARYGWSCIEDAYARAERGAVRA